MDSGQLLANHEAGAGTSTDSATSLATRSHRILLDSLDSCASVPSWRKILLTTLFLSFLLLIADIKNHILIERSKLPEKNLLLTLVFVTPTVRIPYLVSRNHTHSRSTSLILPSLRNHFYDIHYKRKVNDHAANQTIVLGAFLAAAQSKRCSRVLFFTPRVINLRATTALLYRGYYGLEETPSTVWSKQNILVMPEDRVARWTLRNKMAERNEANLYTISCGGKNVAAFVRYLNRKARQDNLFTEELDNGSSIMDLLLFQYFSEAKELPKWAEIHTVVYCYGAVVRELIKGFELDLSRKLLEDVASRLRKVQKKDAVSHNLIMYVTDYEELMGLDKYMQLYCMDWLIPHMACIVKVFEGGRIQLRKAFVPDSRWGLGKVQMTSLSAPYNLTELVQSLDRALI